MDDSKVPEVKGEQITDCAVSVPHCPYCGGSHLHGWFGQRVAHCGKGQYLIVRETTEASSPPTNA